jgi:hypothetical protein
VQRCEVAEEQTRTSGTPLDLKRAHVVQSSHMHVSFSFTI